MRADEAGGAGDEVAHGRGMLAAAAGLGDGRAPSSSGDEADLGEVARHHDALAEVAEARLGSLAARERERELRIAAARGERDAGSRRRSAC